MRTIRPLGLALCVALVLSASPASAAASPDALAFVPADATTVGFVRIADLRSNPFQLRVLEETDKWSADGEGARFLEEAGLNPREDVDAVIACTSSQEGTKGQTLVLFEGRFDPARLAAAAGKRGATRQTAAGVEYYRLREKAEKPEGHGPGAVVFFDRHLVLAGNEPAVIAALSNWAAGTSGFSAGKGLGEQLRRVDPAASAWVLVDVNKWRRSAASVQAAGPSATVVSALRSVSTLELEARVDGDALAVKATGLSQDEETRELIEDALRGALAAWRMAAQEKAPDLVSAIRQFKVARDEEGVTISGTLPGELIRTLQASKHSHSGQ